MQQKVLSNIWSSPFDNVHAHQLLAILFDEHHLELRILGCWSSVEVGWGLINGHAYIPKPGYMYPQLSPFSAKDMEDWGALVSMTIS